MLIGIQNLPIAITKLVESTFLFELTVFLTPTSSSSNIRFRFLNWTARYPRNAIKISTEGGAARFIFL